MRSLVLFIFNGGIDNSGGGGCNVNPAIVVVLEVVFVFSNVIGGGRGALATVLDPSG